MCSNILTKIDYLPFILLTITKNKAAVAFRHLNVLNDISFGCNKPFFLPFFVIGNFGIKTNIFSRDAGLKSSQPQQP